MLRSFFRRDQFCPLAEFTPSGLLSIHGYQTRQRLAVLGDDDLLALSGFVDQTRKLRFRLVKVDLLAHTANASARSNGWSSP